MRGKTILFSVILVSILSAPVVLAGAPPLQDQQDQVGNQNKRKLQVPERGRRRHRDTPRHRGIGHAYKGAGQSAAHGSKRFARNFRHGKPLKAGKEFGKGMGGVGKGVGKGTGRTGKKVGGTIKHSVTP